MWAHIQGHTKVTPPPHLFGCPEPVFMSLFGAFNGLFAISICFFLVNIAGYPLEKTRKRVKSPLLNAK